MDMNLSTPWKIVKDRETWYAVTWDHKESDTTELLNNNKYLLNLLINLEHI